MTSPEELAFNLKGLQERYDSLQSHADQQADKIKTLSEQALAADKKLVALERELSRERFNAGVEVKALKERLEADQTVLERAEALLRGAGVKRVVLSGPPHDTVDFVELGRFESAPDGMSDGVDANTLAKAFELFGKTPGDVRALLASRPATDEAEALRKQVAELESQLASVTKERDCSSDRMRVTAERLEAADRHIESLDSDYASERDRRIKAERERDEALAKLAERDKVILILEGQRDTFRDAHKNAAADCELRAREYAELAAARPEPVVIDEALAERVHGALKAAQFSRGDTEAAVMRALQVVFGGDLASVSVPQASPLCVKKLGRIISGLSYDKWSLLKGSAADFYDDAAKRVIAHLEAARQADVDALIAAGSRIVDGAGNALNPDSVSVPQGDGISAPAFIGGHEWQWQKELDQLRVEFEKTRGELADAHEELTALKEQRDFLCDKADTYEALRGELEKARAELEACKTGPLSHRLEVVGVREVRDCHIKVMPDGSWSIVGMDAETEKTRAELEACKRELFGAKAYGDQMCKARDRVLEQHEALRAGVEYGCEALERHDGPENKTTSWYAEHFRALLKPAPAEADQAASDLVRLMDARMRASIGTTGEEPVQHPLAEQAMMPASQQWITDQLSALWHFVEGVAEQPHYENTPELLGKLAAEAIQSRCAKEAP